MTETLSQLRLHDLLGQVQDRVTEIFDVRDRMDRLIEAMLVVTTGLDLDDTLRSIVHTAIELVDAQYGALGVRETDKTSMESLSYQGRTIPVDGTSGALLGDDTKHSRSRSPRSSLGPIIGDERPARRPRIAG